MIKHVLAIAAGKGGVGKSTISVNLALALQKAGARVGLLDADLYGPSVRQMLPEERLPEQSSDNPEKIFPAYGRGIAYISMAFFRNEQEAALVRAPIANSAIVQFIQSIEWGDLDYLIVDFPPGTGDIQLTLAQQANLSGAFLVTLPQLLSRIDVLKAAQLFKQANVPILGIIENMYDLFPGDAGDFLSSQIETPLVAKIPFDTAVCTCADRGLDLFIENPQSVSTKAFIDLSIEFQTLLTPYRNRSVGFDFSLKDSKTLRLEWKDGIVREIAFADLQKQCPCMRCRQNTRAYNSNVQADSVSLVGKYGLFIKYQSGCSRGIYPFGMLDLWRTSG